MSTGPRFSILVPTRDRPDLVAWCLESVLAQTLDGFEIIVSDNAVTAPCREVVERLDDDRVRYVTPPRALSMADNWEHALGHASGELVCVLHDKSVLLSGALAAADAAFVRTGAEIVSWWNEGFEPDVAGGAGGWYEPYFQPTREAAYEPGALLAESLSFASRRGTEGTNFARGKISFGAFSRALIDRILRAQGRLFFPIAPDYASRTAALCLARSAVDLGRPLMLTYRVPRSNGPMQRADAGHARRFLAECDPRGEALDALPIPGLYASQHNLVAYDMVATIARVAPERDLRLDRAHLMVRAGEDLDLVERWENAAQEREQRSRLETAIAELDPAAATAVRTAIRAARPSHPRARVVAAVRSLLARHRPLRALEVRVRRPWATPRRAANVIEATRIAESRALELSAD